MKRSQSKWLVAFLVQLDFSCRMSLGESIQLFHALLSAMVFYVARSSVRYFDPRVLYGCAAGYRLFLSERDSDVAIQVRWEGGTWHLPAHRLVLAAMSDVFRKMFDTDMLERSSRTITITDCSPQTVKQFLRYLYLGNSEFANWLESTDLLKIAHKYGVGPLVVLCESHLMTAVNFANVCHLFEVARTYSLPHLEKVTCNLILDAAYIVSATEGFLHLQPKSLDYFLKSKFLIMENECCVLTTLREWAQVSCSRRGRPLTRENVLDEMYPFMKYVKWSLIPEPLRTFVPNDMVVEFLDEEREGRRKNFHVAASLQPHIHLLKFVVELGAFYEPNKTSDNVAGLSCLRFGIDNHVFVAGFKIVGMFRSDSTFSAGPSSLTLGREDNRTYTQFNLNSLPWAKGSKVGEYVWRELTAYLPFPVRLDPFGTYVISLKYGARRDSHSTRWPCTRLENGNMTTPMGNVHFHCCSACFGITQLFVLPAPPSRNVCNDTDST